MDYAALITIGGKLLQAEVAEFLAAIRKEKVYRKAGMNARCIM